MTGCVAKNLGIVKRLEDTMRARIVRLHEDPQIVGALGTAVMALETVR